MSSKKLKKKTRKRSVFDPLTLIEAEKKREREREREREVQKFQHKSNGSSKS